MCYTCYCLFICTYNIHDLLILHEEIMNEMNKGQEQYDPDHSILGHKNNMQKGPGTRMTRCVHVNDALVIPEFLDITH